MTTVVNFPEKDKPHATGVCACWQCGKVWQAVWPVDLEGNIICACGARVETPPMTDEEAIRLAADKLMSAYSELMTLRDKFDGPVATTVHHWAHSQKAVAKMLLGYLGEKAPGHTDLMATPESIDKFMEENPLPDNDE